MKIKHIFTCICLACAIMAGCDKNTTGVLMFTNNGEQGGNGGSGEQPPAVIGDFYQINDVEPLDWSGEYLIIYKSGSDYKVFDAMDGTKGLSNTSFTLNDFEATGLPAAKGDPHKATIAKLGEGYSIHIAGVGYIGLEEADNKLNSSETAPDANTTTYLWKISLMNAREGICHIENIAHSGRILKYNNSASCFRCYSSGQKDICLYKRSSGDSTGGGNTGGGNEGDGGNTGEGGDGGNTGGESGGNTGGDSQFNAAGNTNGWLKNYEVPYAELNLEAGKGYSSTVSETYGNSLAYIYETKESGYRVVTHTFKNNNDIYRNYSFLYDYEKHVPLWLAYQLNSGFCPNGGSRTDDWAYDPAIPSQYQPNLSSSYKGGSNNRGHMLASHSRSAITVANRQAFYYTNITPQNTNKFNTGGAVWNALEDAEKANLPSGRDTMYVVTGCIFEGTYDKDVDKDGLECPVPTTFFKCFMLLSFDGNGNITASKGVGYLFPHDDPKTNNYNKYRKTIDEVERASGYNFFANVPDKWQTPAENTNALVL